MIARGFKPVAWVAAVAVPALCCYMLSLKVAAERAELAAIEARIQTASQDIRTLQTELGTRGRLQQLEQWNADVLALSAPVAAQFVGQGISLARFDTRQPAFDAQAEVRMASAAPPAAPTPVGVTPQQASLPREQAAAPSLAAPLSGAPQRAAARQPDPAPLPAIRRASLSTDARPAADSPARSVPLTARSRPDPAPTARVAAEARPSERRRTAATPPATAAALPRRPEARGSRGTALVSADTAAALRREARVERQRARN